MFEIKLEGWWVTTPGTLWREGEIAGHITSQNLNILKEEIATQDRIEVTRFFSHITNTQLYIAKDSWEESWFGDIPPMEGDNWTIEFQSELS